MTGWAELEAQTAELTAAVERLISHCRKIDVDIDVDVDVVVASDFEAVEGGKAPQPLIPPEAPAEAHRARRPILAKIAKLHTLLAEPADFLQELARQVGLSFSFPSYPSSSLFSLLSSLFFFSPFPSSNSLVHTRVHLHTHTHRHTQTELMGLLLLLRTNYSHASIGSASSKSSPVSPFRAAFHSKMSQSLSACQNPSFGESYA